MSNRNIANELLSLVVLVNAGLPPDSVRRVSVDEVRHFIVGVKQATLHLGATVTFNVASGDCAVVVAIEEFNVDTAEPIDPQTMLIGSEGQEQTRNQIPSQWGMGDDLFYVFGPGVARIALTASPEAGATAYYARVAGYYVPVRALERLSRVGTRVLSTL